MTREQNKFLKKYQNKIIYHDELTKEQIEILKYLKSIHFIESVNSVSVLSDRQSDKSKGFSYRLSCLGKQYLADRKKEKLKLIPVAVGSILLEKLIEYIIEFVIP